MHNRFSAAAFGCAFAVALAGCQTVATTAPGPISSGPISSGSGTAAAIVKAAQSTCQFVPTAATIAGILTTQPGLTTAEAVANAICAAIAPLSSGPGLEGVRQGFVGSTKVRGRFVR